MPDADRDAEPTGATDLTAEPALPDPARRAGAAPAADTEPAEAPVAVDREAAPTMVIGSEQVLGASSGFDDERTQRITDEEIHYRDWGWVQEWRSQPEKPAWAPGIAMAIFVAALVAIALIVLTAGLSDNPILAIGVNVVIAAGMAPALWLSRELPVLRFLAVGAAVGLVVGWICMLLAFPHWS